MAFRTNQPRLSRRGIIAGFCATATAVPVRASDKLLIAAASDLQAVMPALTTAFRAAHGVDVTVSFGSTGNIARQIRQGAPFEVFLAADESFVLALARDRVIADEGAAYARGRLAVVVSRRGIFGAAVPSMEAIAGAARDGKAFRIALANPEVAPYGQRAIEVLTQQGLLELLRPRLVYGESVAQALQFVATGAAAAGLVGSSLLYAPNIRDAVGYSPVPEAWHTPLIQRLAVTAKGGSAARSFATFMVSRPAREILLSHGFAAPS